MDHIQDDINQEAQREIERVFMGRKNTSETLASIECRLSYFAKNYLIRKGLDRTYEYTVYVDPAPRYGCAVSIGISLRLR